MDPIKDLSLLLEEIRSCCDKGNRKALSALLKELMKNRQNYYSESINRNLQDEFSDSLYKILLLELDEDEKDSIETAELSYAGLNSLFSDESRLTPLHYKRRFLLLHYFSDYFTDAVIEIFLQKYREHNLLEARNIAMECIEKMQLSDMMWLEDHHPGFIDGDEQLKDAFNSLGDFPDFPENELDEALLLHKVLYAYLKAKYKN